MEDLTEIPSRRLLVRMTIAFVCAGIFGNMPMNVAYAQAASVERAPTIQFGPYRTVTMADRNDVAALSRRNAQRKIQLANAHRTRVRKMRAARVAAAAKKDALFRADHLCPVDHPRLFSDDFGDPRRGKHIHLGNDVVAPMGTPIRAPIDGIVTHGVDPRGGTILKLWGNGGHFYMAHLSKYGKEGRVKHGDVIGYVGDSGEARGGPPHNHVEWHPGNGPAVNPYRMLVDLCYPRTYADVVVGMRLMGLPRR